MKLTDRAPEVTDADFDFDNGDYFDPIAEIIKEGSVKGANSLEKEDIRPFN